MQGTLGEQALQVKEEGLQAQQGIMVAVCLQSRNHRLHVAQSGPRCRAEGLPRANHVYGAIDGPAGEDPPRRQPEDVT